MTDTTSIQLTPARKRFIKLFDEFTQNGSRPANFRTLREVLKVQSRTMNYCYRSGLIKKTAEDQYIIDPLKRKTLGLEPAISSVRTIKIKPRKRIVRIMIG